MSAIEPALVFYALAVVAAVTLLVAGRAWWRQSMPAARWAGLKLRWACWLKRRDAARRDLQAGQAVARILDFQRFRYDADKHCWDFDAALHQLIDDWYREHPMDEPADDLMLPADEVLEDGGEGGSR